jgi:hypothetical protein
VIFTGNTGCFKKELCCGIPNVTVWRVLRKRLHFNAYKLSICTPFNVNFFVTVATQQYLEYHCKAVFETPRILKREIKFPSNSTCPVLKSRFTRSLSFDTGHASNFSNQSPHVIPFLANRGSTKKNSIASVRKRTIPTERPPLVSEVSANFLRIEGATWLA